MPSKAWTASGAHDKARLALNQTFWSLIEFIQLTLSDLSLTQLNSVLSRIEPCFKRLMEGCQACPH